MKDLCKIELKGRVQSKMINTPKVQFFMLSWPIGLPTIYGPPGSRGSISRHIFGPLLTSESEFLTSESELQSLGESLKSLGESLQSLGESLQSLGESLLSRGESLQSLGE